MSTDIKYYFRQLEKFPIPGFLTDLKQTYEMLEFVKKFLTNSLVNHNICENHGDSKGSSAEFHGNYYVERDTVIYNNVTIIGPVYIGANVEIMPGATIRPYTIIGDNCCVGHGSEVKHTIMFPGSKVASLSFVGNSVLGVSSRVGSGVITANRRFDQGQISLKTKEEKQELNSDYFGVVLGDSSRIGANCTTAPGTHVGPYSWIFPQTCIRGFIPESTRVMTEAKLAFAENPKFELKP